MAVGISLTLGGARLLERRMEPILLTYARVQVENTLREQCSLKITALLSERTEYSDILTVTSREAGDIVAVYTDTALIGQLKAEAEETLADILRGNGIRVSVPIGNLWKDGLLYGRGPCVSLKVSALGRAVCSLESVYQSCGINQTKYIMTMDISVDGEIFSASAEEGISFHTEYPISEVILPGYVPDYYSQIDR